MHEVHYPTRDSNQVKRPSQAEGRVNPSLEVRNWNPFQVMAKKFENYPKVRDSILCQEQLEGGFGREAQGSLRAIRTGEEAVGPQERYCPHREVPGGRYPTNPMEPWRALARLEAQSREQPEQERPRYYHLEVQVDPYRMEPARPYQKGPAWEEQLYYRWK